MHPDSINKRIKSRIFNLKEAEDISVHGNKNIQSGDTYNSHVNSNTETRGKRKVFLEKIPFIGPLLMWCWRMLTLPSRFHRLSRHFETEVQGHEEQMHTIHHTLEDLRAAQNSSAQQMHHTLEGLRATQDSTTQQIRQSIKDLLREQEDSSQKISRALDDIQSRQELKDKETNQSIEGLLTGQERAFQQIDALNNHVIQLKDHLERLNEMVRHMQESPILEDTFSVNPPTYLGGMERKTDDESILYVTFEDIFRGSQSEIGKRQQIYLENILESLPQVRNGKYFLDAGCGRGEFLKLLMDKDIPVKGVETNTFDYDNLTKQNLDIELKEVNSFLQEAADSTLIGISALQVIEHFTETYAKDFIKLAFRKIAANGLIIIETINPKCSYSFGSFFYIDFSHKRPYPPELLKFLLEWYGFHDVTIIYSSPCPSEFRMKGPPEHNYMDYAVVGRKK